MSGLEKVKEYLEEQCKHDAALKEKYNSGVINKCWDYIVSQARKAAIKNCACIEEDIVYQWARHFYLEDLADKDIKEEKITIKKESEKKQNNEQQMSLFELGV